MGSHPTLDHHMETRDLGADRVDLAPRHPQVRTGPDHNSGDRVRWAEPQQRPPIPPQQQLRAPRQRTGQAQLPSRQLEQTFDRLNPDYGVPADTHNPYGRQAMRDREAALALSTRVAVATSRENDPNPVMWLAGQDYRAADATRTARLQVARSRHGPEWLGLER